MTLKEARMAADLRALSTGQVFVVYCSRPQENHYSYCSWRTWKNGESFVTKAKVEYQTQGRIDEDEPAQG